jgi:hypothetical protein
MKTHSFLEHHGIEINPFAEEDAQTDPVFKKHCIDSTYHPTWDKVYGDPTEPATAMVFGEKGSGKTAMRLQIVRHLDEHNRTHADQRVYVIEYDDFNPFLDRFRDRLSHRQQRPDRVLGQWKLWDHMDAILSLGVTGLVDRILECKFPSGSAACHVDAGAVDGLDRNQSRDLLLLAACYDQSVAEPFKGRWHRLRRTLGFSVWKTCWDVALGIGVLLLIFTLIASLGHWDWLALKWPYIFAVAGWGPWLWRAGKTWLLARRITKQVRVGIRETGPLWRALMHFPLSELSGQPLPAHPRTDDRYEMLQKYQGVLRTLGFTGIIVVVDRVDEPHLITGSTELMKALVWSMLDNKFLKHPGMGIKLLLPVELERDLDREDRDFHQRARLDKQNMIRSLQWSPEALLDMTAVRLKACAAKGSSPTLRAMLDDAISDRRIMDALASVRVPRHLFKFMYNLLVAHCNAHTDDQPSWKISSEMFESVLAVYNRDQDAVDRGLRAG